MTTNKDSTRFYSNMQEKQVCMELNAYNQSNSGAGHFRKGDCINKKASLLIECKTTMKSKESVAIKQEWVKKLKEEAFTQRMSYTCIAFNYEPGGSNYYVIDSKLMQFLVDKLENVE